MKETTLIFDYDGTIHNTLKIYEPAFRTAYRWLIEKGQAEEKDISAEQISGWIGLNAKEMWNSFMPDLPQEYKERAGAMVGTVMLQQIEEHKAQWYPGARDTLEKLRPRYNMVVLSNCKFSYKQAHWKEFGMKQLFDAFYDCESYGFAPKTEIVKNIMSTYPGEYIVIGDRIKDMECAAACNGRFIGCLYGFCRPGELDGADMTIDNITQLQGIL